MRRLDLTGQTFGRLTVQEFAGVSKYRQSIWNCLCDCGNNKKVEGSSLKNGSTKSCGCLNAESARKTQLANFLKHGRRFKGTHNRTYEAWSHMKDRCYNSNNKKYKHYGGRGITVCPRWLGEDGFQNFLADMGDVPDSKSLDRKNNEGVYEPENCRWAIIKEQNNNTRHCNVINFGGESHNLTWWADKIGIKPNTLCVRLQRWDLARALTEQNNNVKSLTGGE